MDVLPKTGFEERFLGGCANGQTCCRARHSANPKHNLGLSRKNDGPAKIAGGGVSPHHRRVPTA
jgi:hypothetical protein